MTHSTHTLTRSIRTALSAGVVSLGALGLAACGGGGSGSSSGDGSLTLGVTDAPVDNVDKVQITFDQIAIKPAEGEPRTIELEEPVVIENLLDLQGNAAAPLLPETSVDAGEYEWIRLFVIAGESDSFVVESDGNPFDLLVPGQQRRPTAKEAKERFVQLSEGFTVPAGGDADFTIDIQLKKALTKPTGLDLYFLRPSLRLIDNTSVGSIEGDVGPNFEVESGTLVMDSACGGKSVYVYPDDGDGDFTAGDIGSDNEPVTTVDLKAPDTDSDNYTYVAGFLEEGSYKVAVACSADDTLDGGDDVPISQVKDATVTADEAETVDFLPSP